MVNRLQPLNLFDFTGGLNLRAESFQLLPNEFPDVLNLEPDARGGIQIRKGWDYWGDTEVTTDPWNPRNAYLHINSDGTMKVLLANAQKLYYGINGAFTQLAGVVVGAIPHQADFASWNDVVRITGGYLQPGYQYNGVTNNVVTLTSSGSGNWQNDYAQPGSGTNQPRADVIAQHAGYLFVANTNEDTVRHPTRIRWSHPNNPNAWALNDYIDITEGGDRITAMVSFSDRLLVFKPDSVWALFGYDAETWELANISRNIGCVHQQAITRSEGAAFFMSWPQGIFAYTDRGGVQEISVNLRPLFLDNQLSYGGIQNVWMGWMNRRLWVSMPWIDDPAAGLQAVWPGSAFVLDPECGPGAWTKFRGADGCVPGPYMERPMSGQDIPLLAFCRGAPHAMILDARDDGNDIVHGLARGYDTKLRTAWMDAGGPTHKKSWRRPDFLLRGIRNPTRINVAVFHNFDHINPERQFSIDFSPATDHALWGHFRWGDGTQWGRGTQTASPERGSTMGRAGAIQVEAVGERSKPWGINGIVFKYVPRRFR